MDVEDICDIEKPDDKSVMTYVAQYFHAFSSQDKDETAGRRVAKFADVLHSIWKTRHSYEERVTAVRKIIFLTYTHTHTHTLSLFFSFSMTNKNIHKI